MKAVVFDVKKSRLQRDFGHCRRQHRSLDDLCYRSGPHRACMSRFGSQKLLGLLAKTNNYDLQIIRDLMATGKVTPVIDRRYSLSEVPDAIRYLEGGHARGKVVMTLQSK